MSKDESPQGVWIDKFRTISAEAFAWLTPSPARYVIWHNPLNFSSLRLTKTSWHIIRSNNMLKFYKFELPEPILPKTLLQLEKHFTAPYYIATLSVLYVSGETEAIMLQLNSTDLQGYLNNFS